MEWCLLLYGLVFCIGCAFKFGIFSLFADGILFLVSYTNDIIFYFYVFLKMVL